MKSSKLSGVLLVAVCLAWLSGAGLWAQEGFSVDVDVACDDSELRTLSRAYFSRTFRDLGDVRVSETATPDFRIEAIAIKEKRGWVLSVVVTSTFAGDADASLDSEMATSLAEYVRVIDHSLMRGDSNEDLGEEIERIAYDFDREILKPRRKAMKKK